MKAEMIHSFGGGDVLKLEDAAVPKPAPDEVLIKVHAAGVNPIDYKIRSGQLGGEAQLPFILGRDVSGTVERYGSSVIRFKRSDEVYALLDRMGGAYAEFVPVKDRALANKPERLTHAEAAAVPLAGLTAWQGLFDHGELQAGQQVLIHGGAGGVGHLAIQLAKYAGASVVTTVSREDFDFARELGADLAIDYRAEPFEEALDEIDLVLDLIGGATQERSWAVIKDGGTLVSTVSVPAERKESGRGVRGKSYLTQPSGAQLEEISTLIDTGAVRPHVHAVYPLSRAGEAQHRLERAHVQGKIVLEIAP